MCAVHTLPYLSHKLFKIMFLLEYLLKLYQQCLGFNYGVLQFLSTFSIYILFDYIYKDIFTGLEARKYILFEW